ncbi:hypothetical protein GALL_221570 [mine drainage metagenome]|uniref:Uncharacterized protein n=1 Tax=mine drainage metagenome TaxID=410659 RepID=A0A1J5RV12_9ZZZZ
MDDGADGCDSLAAAGYRAKRHNVRLMNIADFFRATLKVFAGIAVMLVMYLVVARWLGSA